VSGALPIAALPRNTACRAATGDRRNRAQVRPSQVLHRVALPCGVARARRILIVEDEPKTAASVDAYLRHGGFRTELARSGPEGLQRAVASS
jgi:hypothetical protein